MSGTESPREPFEARGRRLPGILKPLRHRDYRLLAVGSVMSLLGDGFLAVAIALQVLAITEDSTAAVGVVGAVWAGSSALSYLIGGWAGDRFERRRIMISADVVRGVVVGLMGVLGAVGALNLWHMLAVGVVVGFGNAFFNPAANAIVADLLPSEDLPQANAFWTAANSAMLRLAGPVLGGFVVATTGPAIAFLIDSATFFFSAAMLSLVQTKLREDVLNGAGPRLIENVREGMGFVRTHSWCWAYIVGIGLSLLAWSGPVQALLPIILKADMGLGLGQEGAARVLGLIFASGGLGMMAMSAAVGQRDDLPRRFVMIMYVAQALAILTVGVYGLMTAAWQGMIAAFVAGGLFVIGSIYWNTMLQRLVPDGLRSRVFSVGSLVSFGLLPASWVVAGILGTVADPQVVIRGATALGSVAMLALLLVPGVRNPESLPEARAGGSEGAGA
ncbi:MAG: MFS transporter [Egibacteraceae bacterium]